MLDFLLTVQPDLARLTQAIDRQLANAGHALCVIDGYCGAGKTTLAQALSRRYDAAPIIHMDDFFLPFALRTPERLAQPGGNVHHERFAAQVLEALPSGAPFAYQRFDCQTGALMDRQCPASPLRIVEGSYSLHPALQPGWQALGAITVFLDVAPDEQLRRIAARSPEKLQAFVDRWIPLEKNYVQAYDIREWAQLALTSQPWEDHP